MKVIGARLVAIPFLILGLGGCTGAYYGPPNEYSTAPIAWVNNPNVSHNPYNPVINNQDQVRREFLILLKNTCLQYAASPKPDQEQHAACKGNVDPTSFRCWAAEHESAKECAELIAMQAVDQCVSKTGGQNFFSAKANIALGSILSAANLAAAAAAITNPGQNSSVDVALASNLASGANNAKGFAPTTVTLKVADFISSEQSYVMAAHFTNQELKALLDIPDNPDPKFISSPTVLKYSRLHDAVYAVCPVGAY